MKKSIIFLMLLVGGCSFSKSLKKSETISDDIVPVSSVELSVQEKIFKLVTDRDISTLDEALNKLNPSSFSFKDKSNRTPADLLIALNDQAKIDLFIKHGLSIYESSADNQYGLLESKVTEIENYLNRYSILRVAEIYRTYPEQLHAGYVNSVADLIQDDKSTEAFAQTLNLKMPCQITSISIAEEAIARNISDTSKITDFIQQHGCIDEISERDVQFLYESEVKRQFQNGFKDLALLNLLLYSKNMRTGFFNIEAPGVKISLRLIRSIRDQCQFQEEKISSDEFIKSYDNTASCTLAPKGSFKDYGSFRESYLDFILTKDGRRVLSMRIDESQELPIGLSRQITSYMFGFSGGLQWDQALFSIYHPKP